MQVSLSDLAEEVIGGGEGRRLGDVGGGDVSEEFCTAGRPKVNVGADALSFIRSVVDSVPVSGKGASALGWGAVSAFSSSLQPL